MIGRDGETASSFDSGNQPNSGAPPPGVGPPDGDEDGDPGDGDGDPGDEPAYWRCRYCQTEFRLYEGFSWEEHYKECPNRPASPDAGAQSVASGSREPLTDPLDDSDAEHLLVTETDSRQVTEELVMHDLQNVSGRQSSLGDMSQAAASSPPSVLHTEFQPDEGTLPVERFAALRASTADKPEESVSPSAGAREEGSPVAEGAAGLVNTPVFGEVPPLQPPLGVQPARPFESLPSPNPARKLRRQNVQGFTVDTIPYTPASAWEHYYAAGSTSQAGDPDGYARAGLPDSSRPEAGAHTPPQRPPVQGRDFSAVSPVRPAPPLPDVSVLSDASEATGRSATVPFSDQPQVPGPAVILPRSDPAMSWIPASV